jgi:hypothetical protein
MREVTLVDGGRQTTVEGDVRGDRVLITAAGLRAATGWDLRTEGLCRGDVCVPYRSGDGPRGPVADGDLVDITAVAAVLRRPVAFEPAAAIAVLAASPDEHAAVIASGEAPPFRLPDLDGNLVSLHDFRGRKKLLLAWASW